MLHIIDFVILAALGAWLFAAVRRMRSPGHAGCGGCSGACSGCCGLCSHCAGCASAHK